MNIIEGEAGAAIRAGVGGGEADLEAGVARGMGGEEAVELGEEAVFGGYGAGGTVGGGEREYRNRGFFCEDVRMRNGRGSL